MTIPLRASPVVARPAATEHAPYAVLYVDATARALALQGDDDLMALLGAQTTQLRRLLDGADPALAQYAYAPGKWTLAESLLHVADTERVFTYRLLRIARGDQTPLAGFEQDAWVPYSRASSRTATELLDEIEAVRGATLALVGALDDGTIAATGTAGGVSVSVRALVWLTAGHFAHHLDLTRDRYLTGTSVV